MSLFDRIKAPLCIGLIHMCFSICSQSFEQTHFIFSNRLHVLHTAYKTSYFTSTHAHTHTGRSSFPSLKIGLTLQNLLADSTLEGFLWRPMPMGWSNIILKQLLATTVTCLVPAGRCPEDAIAALPTSHCCLLWQPTRLSHLRSSCHTQSHYTVYFPATACKQKQPPVPLSPNPAAH